MPVIRSFLIFAYISSLALKSGSLSAQTIETFAGGGMGDGGPAVNAILSCEFLAMGPDGDLYAGGRLRRIDLDTGIIMTHLGGGTEEPADGMPASRANWDAGRGIGFDARGNLYMRCAEIVFRIDRQTGIISRLAGGGTEELRDGILATEAKISGKRFEVDGLGNLFFWEFDEHRVRRVDHASGIITTIAGTGEPGFSGDGGPAVEANLWHVGDLAVNAQGDVYLIDQCWTVIRRIDSKTQIITTVAGGGTVFCPEDCDGVLGTEAFILIVNGEISVGTSRDLFISMSMSGNVLRLDQETGRLAWVAGRSSGFSGDGGPALEAGFEYVGDVVEDSQGNLFIADGHRIRRVDGATGIITTIAGTGSDCFAGDGGPATNAGLCAAGDITFDAEGNAYIADGMRIRKVDDARGIIETVATLPRGAKGIALDDSGNIYVSVWYKVLRIDARTGAIETFAGIGDCSRIIPPPRRLGDGGPAVEACLWYPRGLAFDAEGSLYIADSYNCRVRRVDHATGIITTVAGTGEEISLGDGGPAVEAAIGEPTDIAFDEAGNLYISTLYVESPFGVSHYGKVRKVNRDGIIMTIAGGGRSPGDDVPALEAKLMSASAIAIDTCSNLYISESAWRSVRRVDHHTGTITTVGGGGDEEPREGGPALEAKLETLGLAFGPEGKLYVASKSRVYGINLFFAFRRGDSNIDGRADLADAVKIVRYLFLGDEVGCMDALDSNDSGAIDLADAIYLLSYLFANGPAPASPFYGCGIDGTDDCLSCEAYALCD